MIAPLLYTGGRVDAVPSGHVYALSGEAVGAALSH